MSKRSGSPSVRPLKLIKAGDQWDIAPSQISSPPFQPAPVGPKARILQTYVLSYKPKVEATISLRGNQPEVRFASPESTMSITGDELLQLANCRNDWPVKPVFLVDSRVEPLEDGACRLAKYDNAVTETQEMDVFAACSFVLSKYAVARLKTKLDVMSEHIFKMMESESTIDAMFDCVVRAYLLEFQRLKALRPVADLFDELRHLVEVHVQPSHLVKDFCTHTSGSRWNHYALLTCILAQKAHILSLLQNKCDLN